ALDDLLDDAVSGFAQKRRHPQHAVAFAAGRRVDIDETPRHGHDIGQVYLTHCSRFVRASVFSSRYLTITGVDRLSPHCGPIPCVTARDPGTTTAPSGTTSGASPSGLMIRPCGRS